MIDPKEGEHRYLLKTEGEDDMIEINCRPFELSMILRADKIKTGTYILCYKEHTIEDMWVYDPAYDRQWQKMNTYALAYDILMWYKLTNARAVFRKYVREHGDEIDLTDEDGGQLAYDRKGPMWNQEKAVFLRDKVYVCVRFDGCVCHEDERKAERWLERLAVEMGINSYEMTNDVIRDKGADYSILLTMKLTEA